MEVRKDERNVFSCGAPNTASCISAHTHLCAVALATEVGARGPDGLCGGAAIDLRAGRAVGYGRTIVVCENNQTIQITAPSMVIFSLYIEFIFRGMMSSKWQVIQGFL